MNFEHRLETKRKVIDEKITRLKHDIKTLYNAISEFKKEKEEMEYSKDILENFSKYYQEEEKLIKKMASVGKRIDKLSEAELEKISQFKKLLDVSLFK